MELPDLAFEQSERGLIMKTEQEREQLIKDINVLLVSFLNPTYTKSWFRSSTQPTQNLGMRSNK
ncbi:hypothetical protein NUACC21_04040 [Scytonema sp. NUACC21]